MSYCRFRNTLGDLRDCFENWTEIDEDDSNPVTQDEEKEARKELLKLAVEIVQNYGEEVGATVSTNNEYGDDSESSDDAREKGPIPKL